jgi:hypothetical protein
MRQRPSANCSRRSGLCPQLDGASPLRSHRDTTNTTPARGVLAPTQAILTASNIRIVRSDPVNFDTPVRTEFPSQLDIAAMGWQNCSKTTSSNVSQGLTVAFQRSSSLAVTDSITHTQSYDIRLNCTAIPGVSIGGGIQIGTNATHGTTDTSSYQQSVQRSAQIQLTLKTQTAAAGVVQTWPVNYSVRFHTNAIVEADLSANDKGFKLLSDIIPEQNRTIPINGTIGFVDAADGFGYNYDLDYNSSLCKGRESIIMISSPSVKLRSEKSSN